MVNRLIIKRLLPLAKSGHLVDFVFIHIPMWKKPGFSLCPVTHSLWGPEITGYFVAKRLD